MKEITVEVKSDHLERLAWTSKPILAVAELIWNGLDADASEVQVNLDYDVLGTLQSIAIVDNGLGIQYKDVPDAFGNLGGSWKRGTLKSRGKKRLLHGRAGKGRFKAFALGTAVDWQTKYKDNGGVLEFEISGRRSKLGKFIVGDPSKSSSSKPGTVVQITDIIKNFALNTSKAFQEITEYFALYLRTNPEVGIWYNGEKVNPSVVEAEVTDMTLDNVKLKDGRQINTKMTIIEWSIQTDRFIFLCDADGFTLKKMKPNIHAPGFVFSAYLKSDLIKELDEKNCLEFEDMHPDLAILLDAAKKRLREHFRVRSAEQARDLVEEWKREDIYPYDGSPSNILDEARRQVFDVVALNVNNYLPDFEVSEKKSKKFALRLLREALEESPESIQRILQDVLELPKKQREELAMLLERTSLSAIINASKIVSDRLDFLTSLELLVYEAENKNLVKERSQLHKIIERETWIFGDEYFLSTSDKSLNDVLCRHLELLGITDFDRSPVEIEDKERGIIDLMLSRKIRSSYGNELHHLVVELKRPNQKINDAACTQIRKYAIAVAEDDRFKTSKVRWSFWAVSNEMTRDARRQARQRNLPEGLLFDDSEQNLRVWIKTWGEIIENCRARLEFFQEQLKYSADDESALVYLRRLHKEYLPDRLIEDSITK